ncbi:hypothetical protein, partial [Corynebacterium variabile]|uniref:hypothetical protein n=1 Tax=Corynebacterium variabile TaxID=1727 RepID=UPI0037354BFF
MRPTSQHSRHRKSRRIPRSVLALPLALALAVPVAAPSAGADEEPAAVGDTRAQTLQDAPEAL